MMMAGMMVGMALLATVSFGQSKIDEVRMQRDLEVAENILSTLIKQQYGKRQFFPMEVQASYLAGYGVTFRVPSEMFGNMFFMQGGDQVWNMEPMPPGSSISFSSSFSSDDRAPGSQDAVGTTVNKRVTGRTKSSSNRKKDAPDSARNLYQDKLLEAAKNFVADYGDLLSQLPPNEKIIVTNKGDGGNFQFAWSGGFDRSMRQNQITVEGVKGDVNQFRQGKISRDQLMKKLRVVNSDANEERQADLELFSSILNRLYSRDLSKSFFSDGNIYYERLKDFGAVYHMQVYASNQSDEDLFDMPTVRLQDVDQATRDKKVKELYPAFETSLREDLLEYGRTLKSLGEQETLMLEVNLTRCPHCGIPSALELSVNNSVLQDYSRGKLSKEAAMAKITIKKGPEQ